MKHEAQRQSPTDFDGSVGDFCDLVNSNYDGLGRTQLLQLCDRQYIRTPDTSMHRCGTNYVWQNSLLLMERRCCRFYYGAEPSGVALAMGGVSYGRSVIFGFPAGGRWSFSVLINCYIFFLEVLSTVPFWGVDVGRFRRLRRVAVGPCLAMGLLGGITGCGQDISIKLAGITVREAGRFRGPFPLDGGGLLRSFPVGSNRWSVCLVGRRSRNTRFVDLGTRYDGGRSDYSVGTSSARSSALSYDRGFGALTPLFGGSRCRTPTWDARLTSRGVSRDALPVGIASRSLASSISSAKRLKSRRLVGPPTLAYGASAPAAPVRSPGTSPAVVGYVAEFHPRVGQGVVVLFDELDGGKRLSVAGEVEPPSADDLDDWSRVDRCRERSVCPADRGDELRGFPDGVSCSYCISFIFQCFCNFCVGYFGSHKQLQQSQLVTPEH
uniref:Uncharacterized protein n=1 Tax=Glossina pallidipes TaxID=7398 RepID=A0A1A9ZGB8_GLOPL